MEGCMGWAAPNTIRPYTEFLQQYSAGAEPEPNSGSFSPRSVLRRFPAKGKRLCIFVINEM